MENQNNNESGENKKFSLMGKTFECEECNTIFEPTTTEYLLGIHTITRRLLECPNCHKKTFCKLIMKK